ncbi:hypothetical protein AMC82_CH01127 [Rhizobium phaseoli]|uniref:DUF4238 domain-containing protein n=1 Tax=Rhizobium phaseoli TaxID=396 RepID=UPI0007EAC925|nr:DUF4238 domain-containing protein [Rhizobium phaseoli]ANL64821.1 hypothetical protein AMC84_CH01131 [Rhizobium phaseoli]ANL77633.1 hypothetical protein AMC82_CH01127 [Rhizobium phaseoli]
MARDHYIPQLILDRFVQLEKGRNLNVLDKVSGRLFHPAVKDFGVKDLHTLSSGMRESFEADELPDIELTIGNHFESPAAPLLERVVESSSLEWLTAAQRQEIIQFVALQWVRVPGRLFNFRSAIAKEFDGDEPARNLRVLGTPNLPDPVRDLALMGIPLDAVGLAGVLGRAHLALALAPDNIAAIGDNPVVVHSYQGVPKNLFPTFLVSAPGIDAFLPISPKHILYLHTAENAVTGTVGKTLSSPLHLSLKAINYLNGLQGKAAVRYIVLPRQEQMAQIAADMASEEEPSFDFKCAFFPST